MYKKLILSTAISCTSLTATAAPFMAMDPRSLGMGGTGVSAATSAGAVFYNPALLAAAKTDEDFSLELPTVGARIADSDKLVQDVNDLFDKKYFEKFNAAFSAFFPAGGAPPPTGQFATRKANLVSASEQLRDALLKVNEKTLEATAHGGLVAGIPSKRYGVSLMMNAWGGAGAYAEISNADLVATNDLIETVKTMTPTNFLFRNDPTNVFTSFVAGRAALFGEVGVGFAREFTAYGQDFAAGITPKVVQVVTYDYKFVARELDTAEFQSNHADKSYTSFNIDIGLAKNYGNDWKTGFSIKNLIPQQYKTALGNTVEVAPQARVGASRHTDRTSVALDLDLNSSDPVGFGAKTQYLAIGGEVDVWVLLLRLGYRYNMADAASSVGTIGLGLNVFGLHLDAAAATNPAGNELSASAQLGFRF